MSPEHSPQRISAAGATYLTARQVRARYGDISDMSLWRWLRDEALSFPRPRYINGRRYWRTADLDAWDAARTPIR